jgi:peptidyl-tRNA hydrolase, PTH2 family
MSSFVEVPDDELRIYVLMRRDIGDSISKAKFGVQVAHAVATALCRCMERDRDRAYHYMMNAQPKIVLRVKDDQELLAIADKARSLGFDAEPIVDAARTEFSEPTLTCVGIGPIWFKSEGLFLKRVQLYKDSEID